MKTELYIARRFAFKPRSNSKPTFIVVAAISGIAIGTAALILTLSIVKGFASVIEDKLISFTSHLQVRQSGVERFPETRYDMRAITRTPGIVSVSPFLEMNVMLRSRGASSGIGEQIAPALLRGVPAGEASGFLRRHLIEGRPYDGGKAGPLQVVVGKAMADRLGLKPGSRAMIVKVGDDNAPGLAGEASLVSLLSSLDLDVVTVSGIYETGLTDGFDDVVVLADLSRLQDRFHPGLVSGYEANVSDIRRLDAVSADVAESLGAPFYSYTVYERYANLFEWLKLQKNIMPLLVVTITVVAVFNIVSTLLVLIIEKTREIGMLLALGLEPARVSVVFMAQALMIALAGIGAGNLLAVSLSLFERRFHLITLPEKSYFIRHVPIMLDPSDYLVVSLAVAALALIFSFVPSRVAAALKPGTALTN